MKENILFFGDIHFHDGRRYHYEAGEEFLKFYKELPQNSSDNIAVFLGDLTETFLNDGLVFDQLHRLFEYSKFKHIYVLVGNHDLKKVKGTEHVVYEFVEKMDRVTILRKPADVINIGKFKCLSLPHYNHVDGYLPMYDYYSNLPKSIIEQSYDFVIAHLSDNTVNTFQGKVADLSKIKCKKTIIGHIHNRTNDRYIGSVYPLNPLQEDDTRAVWVLSSTGDWSEIAIPKILGYYEVEFPDPLPHTTHKISCWNVYNCYDQSLLHDTYGDIFIRQINVKPKAMNKTLLRKEDFRLSFSGSDPSKPLELLNELIKSSSTSYDRGAIKILRGLFST